MCWILLGFWNGVSRETLDHRQRIVPNEGIRRSARNSLLMGLIAGGFCGLFGFLNAALYIGPSFSLGSGVIPNVSFELIFDASNGLSNGLIIGMAGGLLAGMLTGGWACLQHLVLRVLLLRAGLFPWHAAQFLDDSARRVQLFKEGGGYRFIHRLFLDYFAALEIPTPPTPANGQETAQAGVSSTVPGTEGHVRDNFSSSST